MFQALNLNPDTMASTEDARLIDLQWETLKKMSQAASSTSTFSKPPSSSPTASQAQQQAKGRIVSLAAEGE